MVVNIAWNCPNCGRLMLYFDEELEINFCDHCWRAYLVDPPYTEVEVEFSVDQTIYRLEQNF